MGGIFIRTYVNVVQIEVYRTHTSKIQHNGHWLGDTLLIFSRYCYAWTTGYRRMERVIERIWVLHASRAQKAQIARSKSMLRTLGTSAAQPIIYNNNKYGELSNLPALTLGQNFTAVLFPRALRHDYCCGSSDDAMKSRQFIFGKKWITAW